MSRRVSFSAEKLSALSRSNSLTIMRKSSLIGHRLSIYVPFLFCPSTTKDPQKLIVEINSHVALFRDMLIQIGQSKDCPELREKIRKLRRTCVEACKHTSQVILPPVKSAIADGVLTDNPHLVLFFYLSQLFLRELVKSYRLIQVVPMDMSGYFENRAGPSNLGNVISQILLCKQITPDFNQEELCSITKDSQEIAMLLSEMQEFMPQHETFFERNAALDSNDSWTLKRRRNSIYKNMGLLCCVSRPSYL